MTVPDRIGRYLVIDRLGEGGIGEVFLAQRDGDSRLCALKRLLPGRVHSESARVRILREGHIATFLDHPNIATVFGAGDEDGSFCIAAEYVPGCDLYSTLQKGVLAPRFCFAIARAVLEALAHAHDAKDRDGRPLELVHRDLSTRNVMVSFAGQVKVIDFGVARAKVDEYRTQTGLLIGSPNYLSPEQAVGDPVDRRADLYSFSAVLFELLTGKRVAGGSTVAAVLHKVVAEDPPAASSIDASLPKELDPILARGLAKDPQERWPAAESYLAALTPMIDRIGAATREELGSMIRSRFPEREEEAARIIAEARARFVATIDDSSQAVTETRAAFWESTMVAPSIVERSHPVVRRRSKARALWPIPVALAVSAVVLVLIPREEEVPPIAATVEPAPIPIAAPSVTPRTIDEPPQRPTPPPPVKQKSAPAPVPTPAEPIRVRPPIQARSPAEQKLAALKARGAGPQDPEIQAFAAELERRAEGNARAESELKKAALCMIDRSCGNDRLYRVLSNAVRAIDAQSSSALNP